MSPSLLVNNGFSHFIKIYIEASQSALFRLPPTHFNIFPCLQLFISSLSKKKSPLQPLTPVPSDPIHICPQNRLTAPLGGTITLPPREYATSRNPSLVSSSSPLLLAPSSPLSLFHIRKKKKTLIKEKIFKKNLNCYPISSFSLSRPLRTWLPPPLSCGKGAL